MGDSAPVTAIAHAVSTVKRGPMSVHSRPAAPSALPTSRLAITNARTSTGPRRRNAVAQLTDAAEVLDGGLGAGLDDANHAMTGV
jgi:hypothetical protein